MSNNKAYWLSRLEKPSLLWFILGAILVLLGVSKGFQLPILSDIAPADAYRIPAIALGVICLIVGSILSYRESAQARKNGNSATHLDLAAARDHLLNEVLPAYRRKTPLTLSDKRDAMAAILRMISLTTIPSTKENLARVGLFEVMKNGRFRILASHHIEAHRLLILENLFSHDINKPVGVVGHAVAERETINIPDVKNPPERYKGYWVETEDNKLPADKARSTLVMPIYRNINLNSEILAALSATTSISNYFTKDHEKELIEYVNIIRNFLDHFETSISFNPSTKQSIRIITISGQTGSGKTTLAKEIYSFLKFAKWEYVVTGDMFRDFCLRNNIDLERQIEKVPDEKHKEFDRFQKELLLHEENLIVEGRMAGYFAYDLGLKDVFKIYCDLPVDERIKRFAKRIGESGKSGSEARKLVTDRDHKDLQTYKRLYDIQDFRKREYYNLYLDMHNSPDELARIVFNALAEVK